MKVLIDTMASDKCVEWSRELFIGETSWKMVKQSLTKILWAKMFHDQ